MSVTVTLRTLMREPKPATERHPRGKTTLIDGRGNLLVLDTDRIALAEGDYPGVALMPHLVATYAEGEWASAKVSSR